MFDAHILKYRINANSFPASCFGGLLPWRTGVVGHISIAPSSKGTGHTATLYCTVLNLRLPAEMAAGLVHWAGAM